MVEIAAKLGQEMADLSRLRASPLGFLWHYVRRHAWGHAIVFLSVMVAVVCAVATQYGLKHLIDIVAAGPAHDGGIWWAFALLCVLVAADNLLWRVGGWAAAYTFVAVTGDIRRDLFAHLSGHSPSYFAERLPGALASRITATANAAFTTANTGSWNVLPPCVGVVCAIIFIGFVNPTMAGALVGVAAGLGALIFHLARRGTPLHRSFASKAAAVDGELVDVIGNMGVVRAFGATFREQKRIGATVGVEMGARRASLLYLERLRLIHAVITAVLIAGVVAWGILLWQQGQATVGDLVLITALSFGILHSTRDLAVALVDLTQHLARLEEAIASLLTEHELPDRPGATALLARCRAGDFRSCPLRLPGARGGAAGIRPDYRARAARRAGGLFRRRQVHRAGAAAAVLRRGARPRPDRRPGHSRRDAGQPARHDGDRAAGHQPVPSHSAGEHPLRASRSAGGGRAGRRRDGELPRVHRGVARRFRHHGGRSRREAVGRTAAASGDCPCPAEGRADPAARRSHQRTGQRERTGDPGCARSADARTHGDRHRASAVDAEALRPDHRDGSRPDYRRRAARCAGGAAVARIATCCASSSCWNRSRKRPECPAWSSSPTGWRRSRKANRRPAAWRPACWMR